mgnify:CR=1 FL=1
MFKFSSDWDADVSKSLTYLINSNSGLFKSEAQKKFLMRTALNTEDSRMSVERHMGVPVEDGQSTLMVDGYTRWADYGSRSYRRSGWVYVVDQYGVVAKYKLKFIYGNGGRSSSVDPDGTECLFKRSPNVVLVKPVDPDAAVDPSNHIGDIGDKVDLTGVVTKVHSFDKTPMGYWDSSVGHKTTIKVGDDILMYWGMAKVEREDGEGYAKEGETVTFKATIKAHGEYKGQKQTTISRPKFKLVELEAA